MLSRILAEIHQYINMYFVITTVCVLIAIYVSKRFYKYAQLYCYVRWKLPGPKLDHPILGRKAQIVTNKLLKEWEKVLMLESPKIARIIFGPLFSVLVTDPEVAQLVYNSQPPKNEGFNYVFEPWLGKSILISSGNYWKRNRRLITPVFHYQSLRNFLHIMNKSSDRLIQVINRDNKDVPIDYIPLVHNMTLEVILNCICSKGSDLQLNIDPNSPELTYTSGIENIKYGFVKRIEKLRMFIDAYYYRKKEGRIFLQGVKMTREYILSMIRERKSKINREDNHENDHYDMLDILLRCRDEEGNGLTQKEIVDELNTFVFAGHDTTSSASSFILYYLAKYPELQEKCREEVKGVIGDRDEFEWDDISKLTYLTCFIKETLRHNTPATFSLKTLNKPITVDSHVIPAGVNIEISIALIHMNPKYWPDPHAFDPTRFSEKNLSAQHPYAFLPFSAGQRNCIGQNFAMAELKVMTAKILNNFSVSLAEGYQFEASITIVYGPTGALPIIFKPI